MGLLYSLGDGTILSVLIALSAILVLSELSASREGLKRHHTFSLGLFMRQRSLSFSPLSALVRLWSSPTYALYLCLGALLAIVMGMPAHAASCKLPKSYYKNVSCTSSSGYFLAIKDFGAPVALINSKGKAVVDLSRYQEIKADKIAGGLIPVQRSNKVGYINMQGREVVPVVYDLLGESAGWARGVSEGRIVVKKNGNYGVINTANKTIVPFSAAISDIDDYRGGVARVNKSRAISWLDKNGNTTSDPNGKDDDGPSSSESNSAKSGLAQSKTAPLNRFTTLQPSQQDGKWGFVDDNNVIMITYSFDEVQSFSEGLAGIRIGKDWGFLSLGGELVIPFRFSDSGVSENDSYKGKPAFVFTDGKAWIGNLKNGNKMCIDKEGTSISCE
ncbi:MULTISPECIES: WG repeat-containing protein [unclassified Psychrobacter]|uniref:WG repeat-containing protein n=1 Tax=unclassified Psychrobacter TaxID=196806 RepID=UPI001D1179A8|nr:WG repeat-containing protein [Psychrobacter sp. SCQQ22]